MVEPNRVMAAWRPPRRVFLLDPEFIDIATPGRSRRPRPAKTGDNKKGVIGELTEGEERGRGVVADVFGLTASS